MSEKIFHLQLKDSMGNKRTLICNLVDGSIKYQFYTGWASTGIALALSNMQVGYRNGNHLPVENIDGETKEYFTYRVIEIINNDSVERVVKVVSNEVKFA